MSKLHPFHGGLHLDDYHKDLSTGRPIADLPLPKKLYLPLRQHIGEAAEPVVKAGDKVLKGDFLAKATGYISAPVHAPSSGTVIGIEDRVLPHPSGITGPVVVLETDGEDRAQEREPIVDYQSMDLSQLRNIIRCAGIVGLGGAVFPTSVKLNPGPGKKIHTLILNGAECEPYITCDDMLMRTQAVDIVSGAEICMHVTAAEKCVIAIEDNKPVAIAAMQQAVSEKPAIEVVVTPTKYPTGSERQLIKLITGREIPSHGLPSDVGVVCVNVGTANSIHNTIFNAQPLISRIVTVTGESIATPQNVRVPIGAPVAELIAFCGGLTDDAVDLIMGGPMMGVKLASGDVPVIKATNCLLIRPQYTPPHARACIRCGECARACPAVLLPQELYRYIKADRLDRAQEFNLFDCIECGCCSWVCPSDIPLVQYYRHAKTVIGEQERQKKKADRARKRTEFKTFRLERARQERAALNAAKKAALKKKLQQQKKDDDAKAVAGKQPAAVKTSETSASKE